MYKEVNANFRFGEGWLGTSWLAGFALACSSLSESVVAGGGGLGRRHTSPFLVKVFRQTFVVRSQHLCWLVIMFN